MAPLSLSRVFASLQRLKAGNARCEVNPSKQKAERACKRGRSRFGAGVVETSSAAPQRRAALPRRSWVDYTAAPLPLPPAAGMLSRGITSGRCLVRAAPAAGRQACGAARLAARVRAAEVEQAQATVQATEGGWRGVRRAARILESLA